ncbi:hypothetical protein [Effusibacillus dendaii]|uniref:hypothetical protein n=1 Tax=Effusibacillus dendaii TaxID=2743772 RepID=UPI00190A30C6|nr:hypothetical protein [Effusibacillus dendaii]
MAYANARVSLENAEKRTSVDVSEASVDQSSVAVQTARDQLANATVISPFSGIVAAVNGEVGEMVSPQVSVVTVVDVQSLKAES